MSRFTDGLIDCSILPESRMLTSDEPCLESEMMIQPPSHPFQYAGLTFSFTSEILPGGSVVSREWLNLNIE
jgi:hypothetical protein